MTLLALLLGCEVATEASGQAALDCTSEPVVTYENVGEGLIVENCQSCHASTAVDRHGAPTAVAFDTHAQVLAWRERVLVVTHPDTRTMPPSLALSEADRHLLEVWLTCWE